MKRIGTGKCLGIAILPGAVQVAEVHVEQDVRRVTHVAEMPLSEEPSLANAPAIGKNLAKLLRDQHISARDVVIGLPARWLVTRLRQVPPATPDVAAAGLRLQAESEFSAELKDVVTDYAGETSTTTPSTVMLIATARPHVASCVAIARAAGLKVQAVTATSAVMAASGAALNGASHAMLNLNKAGAELVVQSGKSPLMLRHLNVGTGDEATAPLASDIRRALAGVPAARVSELLLADPAGAIAGGATALQQRLQMPVRPHTLRVTAEKNAAATHAQSIALALAGLERGVPVDFANSRMAPPRQRTSKQKIAIGAGIAAAVLLLIVLAVWDLRSSQAQLAATQAAFDAMKDEVAQAEVAEARLKFVRNWSPGRERFVACLADLTRLFPDEGVIWATTLSIRADLGGQLAGKATSERHVLALLDKLQDSPQFVDPKLLDMRDGGAGREIAFSISFSYRPRE